MKIAVYKVTLQTNNFKHLAIFNVVSIDRWIDVTDIVDKNYEVNNCIDNYQNDDALTAMHQYNITSLHSNLFM